MKTNLSQKIKSPNTAKDSSLLSQAYRAIASIPSLGQPPRSNRGANSSIPENHCLNLVPERDRTSYLLKVDWVSGTFPVNGDLEIEQSVKALIKVIESFFPGRWLPRGEGVSLTGYTSTYQHESGVKIAYTMSGSSINQSNDGFIYGESERLSIATKERKAGSTVYLQVTGSTLGQLTLDEQLWFLKVLCDKGIKFTRCDVALNDLNRSISIRTLYDWFKDGHKVSFKKATLIESFDGDRVFVADRGDRPIEKSIRKELNIPRYIEVLASTLYLGSRQSETLVRVYDSYANDIAKEKKYDSKFDPNSIEDKGIRYEIELHKQKANDFGQALAFMYRKGFNQACDWLKSQFFHVIQFREASKHGQRNTRRDYLPDWKRFMDSVCSTLADAIQWTPQGKNKSPCLNEKAYVYQYNRKLGLELLFRDSQGIQSLMLKPFITGLLGLQERGADVKRELSMIEGLSSVLDSFFLKFEHDNPSPVVPA